MPCQRNGNDNVRKGGEGEPNDDDDLEFVELDKVSDDGAGDGGSDPGHYSML
jgi:hypothetical protein